MEMLAERIELNASSTSLDRLLMPGPVERGFYIASGSSDLVPSVLDKLVDLLWFDAVDGGDRDTGMLPVRHSTPVNQTWRRPSKIGQIIWIDAGKVFDAERVSVAANRRGLDPMRVRRAINLYRPETAVQLAQMLGRIPRPALWAPLVPDRQSNAFWWTPLVVISNVMNLFHESNMNDRDLRHAFDEFFAQLSFLKKRAIVLALHRIDKSVPYGRENFFSELTSIAD